jgi:hypothetical protein
MCWGLTSDATPGARICSRPASRISAADALPESCCQRALTARHDPRGACLAAAGAPELPEDVEYRIVNHDLVLWDIHADLVVDFLPNAFRAVELTLLW